MPPVLRSTGLPAASSESVPSAAERQQTFGVETSGLKYLERGSFKGF